MIYILETQMTDGTWKAHEQSISKTLLLERQRRKPLYANDPTARVRPVTDVTELPSLRHVPRYCPSTGKVMN
jgi:hypothetical protein